MNKLCKGVAATLAFVPTLLLADSTISDREVTYHGDITAQRVCESVVNDDSARLNRLLRDYRDTLVYRYRFTEASAVAGDFGCNDLALLPFADKIGAQNISNYLRGGVVTMEELISAAD
jgi:hypothetical protein